MRLTMRHLTAGLVTLAALASSRPLAATTTYAPIYGTTVLYEGDIFQAPDVSNQLELLYDSTNDNWSLWLLNSDGYADWSAVSDVSCSPYCYGYHQPQTAQLVQFSDPRAIMQRDGNFVLYDGNMNPVWSTFTYDNDGAWLNVQDDTNIVIYTPSSAPLWSRF
jgi:hypothetical protein